MTLDKLISNLDGLLNALKDGDEEWKGACQKQWGILEDIYADASDKNLTETSNEYILILDNAIENLRKLVSQKA